ncbi:MAG TPA: S4 domain-containing protein, partial [Egibacteraceae bacterium]|nr:S4 domain-containing protein [Egibacteraceae bacterium]
MAGRAALCERVVGRAEDAMRLDVVLSGWLGEPRARVQDRVARGQVTVDGVTVAKSRRLRAGERVVVAQP